MAATAGNPKVDFFFDKDDQWQEAHRALRKIVLACGLDEELKWGVPCYTLDGRNVLIIHGFKEFCALNFFNGALMQDPNGILIQQTENSQASRQIRFTGLDEVVKQKAVLKAYVQEAMAVERSGAKVVYKKTEEFPVPEELTRKFDDIPELKTAFDALTPGRQRGYLLHFAGAKQAKTREARIDKHMQRIFDGKGLTD